ncbi:DIS3-like exonuclease 2 [Limulus polyphemus]|uniref:DIS3-like exonuclease 2 n=1 Tax=Limulus polyphemus TaxID=6850 RepID=A0ABM1SHN1_LIMPO|nr:DIS3-like exonuclease 2 [Limulus polyphemus]XP_022243135.1 DIS3-like exonuclease 2 [Limulus polyphemus]XP_022243136.1 DIS3-like exonuclease 2 [Limulus polyphemus]XP_022243137.1 DIS3-like exonuclease 2 [Limulus polyphemus]
MANLNAPRNNAKENHKTKGQPTKKQSRGGSSKDKFEEYLSKSEVQEGLKQGELIEGVIRINQRNYNDAFISSPDGQMDIYISGMRDRNRALNGDVVVVKLNPQEEWKILWDSLNNFQQKNAVQVFLKGKGEESHPSNDRDLNKKKIPPCSDKSETFTYSSTCIKDNSVLLQEVELQTHCSGPTHSTNQECDDFNSESNWEAGWTTSIGQWRESDTLEILGVDKFFEQVQQLEKQKKQKNKNQRKKNRNKYKQKNACCVVAPHELLKEDIGFDHWESTTVSSLENIDSSRVFQDTSCCQVEMSSTMDSFSSRIFHDTLDEQTKSDFKQLKGEQTGCSSEDHVPCDTWTTDAGSAESYSVVISPEQLLDLTELENFQLPKRIDSDSEEDGEIGLDQDSSSIGVGGIAVAPEDLSPDDDLRSLSGESISSLEQTLEDADFLASCQDARNNNISSPFNNIQDNDQPVIETSSSSGTCQQSKDSCNEPSDRDESLSFTNIDTVIIKSADTKLDVSCKSVTSSGSTDLVKEKKKLRNRKKKKHNKNVVEHLDKSDTKICELNNSLSEPVKCDGLAEETAVKTVNKHCHKKQFKKFDMTQCGNLTVYDIMKTPGWEKFVQKTGKVVYIVEQKHSRAAAGYIKLQQDKNPNWTLFCPTDSKIPRIFVPMNECPQGFFERPADFAKTLFIARITHWDRSSTFPRGTLQRSLGEAGQIEPETEGILLENGVDYSEFPEECLHGLPTDIPWQIPETELIQRKDFRNHCVFTVDPSTARDLDDALSCCPLGDGLFEIGVHIADVTFFLKEDSLLDLIARSKATSVYLVQKVVPMLPRILCEQLCSLNPNEDRLTFSVVWTLTQEGTVVNEWFGRSVIRSCVKLSYEHAQDMIEHSGKTWGPGELPPVSGGFTVKDIEQSICTLHSIAVNLRRKRFEDGALRLDQTKLQFTLDSETGLPSGYSVYEQKDSNRLIEEFMLLANMAVAHKIYKHFPKQAFLRCHPPPQMKMMEDVVDSCAAMGIHLNASSARTLQASLAKYCGEDLYSAARIQILTALCSKPMNCALYFCSGWVNDPKSFHHYALNVPLYTHFTSPIRRYADVIVHRLLAAALGYQSPTSISVEDLQRQASHCNDKKLAGKRVQELSADLFLSVFVKECGPLEEQAMVMGLMDHSFDVLILRMGTLKRVYLDKLPLQKVEYKKEQGVPQLTLVWKTESVNDDKLVQVISVFTLVEVVLCSVQGEPLKFNAVLKKQTR